MNHFKILRVFYSIDLPEELGYTTVAKAKTLEGIGEKAKEAAEASQKQDEKGREDILAPLRARAMAFLDAEKAIKEEIRRISN